MLQIDTHKKQWIGAIVSIIAQILVYIPVYLIFGNLISGSLILLINIYFAANYKNTNEYYVGARWSAFVAMGLVAWSRHHHWYDNMLDSFMRLRNFDFPVEPLRMLCQGNIQDLTVITTTSILSILFYFYTTKWPEWTEKWAAVRTSLLSASLGLQTLIWVSVAYPTPLTLILALLFASLISPILRRQVRLNHIVFLMLVPMFSLGSSDVALVATFVAGIIFIYFALVERALPDYMASFALFNGVVFGTLSLSMLQSRAMDAFPNNDAGLISLICYILTLSIAYLLIFKDSIVINWLRELSVELTPRKLKESKWWEERVIWVDRESYSRTNKLWVKDKPKTDLGTIMFGPRFWPTDSENYTKKEFSKLNLTPSILALAIYALWFGVDTVLMLTDGTRQNTLGGFGLVFILVLAVPVLLLVKQVKDPKHYKILSKVGSGFGLFVLGFYMLGILYSGLTSSQALVNTAQSLNNQRQLELINDDQEDYCSCLQKDPNYYDKDFTFFIKT